MDKHNAAGLRPRETTLGLAAVWATLAIAAASALVARWVGGAADEFSENMVITALMCILPYKIGNGSNAARYIWAVLAVLGLFIVAGGVVPMQSGAPGVVEKLATALTIITESVSIIYLFKPQSSVWFRAVAEENKRR